MLLQQQRLLNVCSTNHYSNTTRNGIIHVQFFLEVLHEGLRVEPHTHTHTHLKFKNGQSEQTICALREQGGLRRKNNLFSFCPVCHVRKDKAYFVAPPVFFHPFIQKRNT